MDYDREKVDEMALALLWLTASGKPGMVRAWKSLDWELRDAARCKGSFRYSLPGVPARF